MSTVLWANHHLGNGEVESDETDKWALYKYADKLDTLASVAGVKPFSSLFDYTDVQCNLGDEALCHTIHSTHALMASDGIWTTADDALRILNALLAAITTEKLEFGAIQNDYDAVVAELSESIEYAKQARALGVSFNFSVVM